MKEKRVREGEREREAVSFHLAFSRRNDYLSPLGYKEDVRNKKPPRLKAREGQKVVDPLLPLYSSSSSSSSPPPPPPPPPLSLEPGCGFTDGGG